MNNSLLSKIKAHEDTGRPSVCFQPVINLKTGDIIALEMDVSPPLHDKDIQPATGNEKKAELDLFLIEQAIAVHSQLDSFRINSLPVAINLSHDMNANYVLLEFLKKSIEQTPVMACNYRLEIPQSTLIENPGEVLDQIKQWQERGYCVVIDNVTSEKVIGIVSDSGVIIKFSESLILDLPENGSRTPHFKLLVQKARAMNLKTSAAGINRIDQLTFLAEAECDEGQGLLISKPRTIMDLLFLLKRGRAW